MSDNMNLIHLLFHIYHLLHVFSLPEIRGFQNQAARKRPTASKPSRFARHVVVSRLRCGLQPGRDHWHRLEGCCAKVHWDWCSRSWCWRRLDERAVGWPYRWVTGGYSTAKSGVKPTQFNRTGSFRPILRWHFLFFFSCLVAPFWGIVKQIDCGWISHQQVQDFCHDYLCFPPFFSCSPWILIWFTTVHTHTYIYIHTQWGLIVHILQLLRHIQSGVKTCIAGFVWIPVVITFSANHFVCDIPSGVFDPSLSRVKVSEPTCRHCRSLA